jgi:hypothetical protein
MNKQTILSFLMRNLDSFCPQKSSTEIQDLNFRWIGFSDPSRSIHPETMPPKADPSEIKILYLRALGGEVGSSATLAPKIGQVRDQMKTS